MKCLECNNKDALQLFSSILCITKTCSNFNESWAKEVSDKTKFDDQQYITTSTDTGAYYLGDEDGDIFAEDIFTIPHHYYPYF